MSFQQGLSGLNAASKNLDIIGNNISNSGTIGYKQSSGQFSDVYANSLAGAGGANVGIGTAISSVQQSFAQGNINVSTNPLDVAINGYGFFRMSNAGAITYTRNGQFQLDKSGFLVNASGARVTGYQASSTGTISTAAPVDLVLSGTDLSPKVTSKSTTQVNLDSRLAPMSAISFDPTDTSTFNDATSMSVYDSLGNSHTLSMYFVKTAANTWSVMATQDGTQIGTPVGAGASGPMPAFTTTAGGTYTLSVGGVSLQNAAAAGITAANIDTAVTANLAALTAAGISRSGTASAGTLKFFRANGSTVNVAETLGAGATAGGFVGGTAAGSLNTVYTAPFASGVQPVGSLTFLASGAIDTVASTVPFNLSGAVSTGATSPLSYSLDLTGSTQFGSSFGVTLLTQDGFASGKLSGFAVGGDGTVLGRYTNGQTRAQGQIVLANFTSPNGLQPLGGNSWGETPQSGAPLVGAPATGSLGVLQSGATEDSNVDLTAELVNMITAQRVYQANAQTIKSQDSVLQTLVNLR